MEVKNSFDETLPHHRDLGKIQRKVEEKSKRPQTAFGDSIAKSMDSSDSRRSCMFNTNESFTEQFNYYNATLRLKRTIHGNLSKEDSCISEQRCSNCTVI